MGDQFNESSGYSQGSFLFPPPNHLRSLPIRSRWEVTRRHPYYQLWWRFASDFAAHSIPKDAAEGRYQAAAVAILNAIGVSQVFPDPSTPFSALEEHGLQAPWLPGAVQPMTFAGIAALLVNALPKETLDELAMLFAFAAGDDQPGKLPSKVHVVHELFRHRDPALKNFSDAPYVSINPAASERQVSRAIHEIVATWKERYGLPKNRDRADKYDAYLAVWDPEKGGRTGRMTDRVNCSLRKLQGSGSDQFRRYPITIAAHSN